MSGEIVLGDMETSQRHIHITITPAQWQGRATKIWWFNDVTEMRHTEAEWRRRERQLHAVLDAAQDAVFELNLMTGAANVSPRFWQMLGQSIEEAIHQQNVSSEAIYHYIREDHQISFASSLRIPQQDEPYEWTGPARSITGEDVWLYMRGRIIETNSEEPKIIGVVSNITAQKAVEENLRQSKEAAEQANAAKSAFLATMSHEIRTPMTAILGSLEYLLDTPLVKEQHRMVSIARESGTALLEILNDILDLSKIEAGKLTLESLPVSPQAMIQGSCDTALIVARQKGISVRCRFVSPPPALIVTDPIRVRQILMNLINNAVKFTERGGVTISAEIMEGQNSQGMLCVTVHDTGIGLSAHQKEKIFRPFTQADDSTTRKFGGTGLGLSICQRLVERMGGKIGVYSKEGQGSIFWFYVAITLTDAVPEVEQITNLQGMKVILVDPEAESGRQIRESLEVIGAKVILARSGREALVELIKNDHIALVLLEQTLPDCQGLQLVPAMRSIVQNLNITLYTADSPETIGWAAQDAGVFYLPRSTPYQQFMETVRSFSEGARVHNKGIRSIDKVKGRVLIAEDTASVRQILEVQVKGLGIDVDFVENGRHALEKMQRGHYSLVISDLHMPEVDGYGLVHEWRERESKRGQGHRLPIIALTADVLIGDKSRFLAEGFDDYVAKPVSRKLLHEVISKWMNKNIEQDQDSVSGNENKQDLSLGKNAQNSSSSHDAVPMEPISTAPDAPIQHERLVEILGLEDAELINESLKIFVYTAKETFAALDEAYKNQDVAAAKGPSHSLKGSARMAGAVILGDIAAEIDAAAKAAQLVPDRLEACRTELARVLNYIDRVYVRYDPDYNPEEEA